MAVRIALSSALVTTVDAPMHNLWTLWTLAVPAVDAVMYVAMALTPEAG